VVGEGFFVGGVLVEGLSLFWGVLFFHSFFFLPNSKPSSRASTVPRFFCTGRALCTRKLLW